MSLTLQIVSYSNGGSSEFPVLTQASQLQQKAQIISHTSSQRLLKAQLVLLEHLAGLAHQDIQASLVYLEQAHQVTQDSVVHQVSLVGLVLLVNRDTQASLATRASVDTQA